MGKEKKEAWVLTGSVFWLVFWLIVALPIGLIYLWIYLEKKEIKLRRVKK